MVAGPTEQSHTHSKIKVCQSGISSLKYTLLSIISKHSTSVRITAIEIYCKLSSHLSSLIVMSTQCVL